MRSYLASQRPPLFSRRGDSKLAQLPHPRPKEIEHPDAHDANGAQPAQQSGAAGDAEVAKQGFREEDAGERERAPEEIVAREQAGRVLRVAERHVDEDALHDHEDGRAVYDDADGGRDPVDVGARGPGEYKQADGGAEGGDQGGHQTVLLDGESLAADARVHVEVQVRDVDDDADQARDQDTQEKEAELAVVHAVVDWVDKREDLEEGVVDAVDDGGINLHEEDGRILDCDFERLDQGVDEHGAPVQVALVDFGLRHEAR